MNLRDPEQPVYQCDRCGAFYARHAKHADEGHPYDDSACWIEWRDKSRCTRHDLCGLCTSDWLLFVAGHPLKP
jgi:hypothetical protein